MFCEINRTIMKKQHCSILSVIVFLMSQTITQAQANTKQDSLQTISISGIFDGKKVHIGNFEVLEVYMMNGYCISLADISQNQADSLKGKKVLITGNLKIIEGRTLPAKTSTNGTIYEPYKEPDKKFISKPSFTIIN